jgi:hypothetical protein
MAFSESLTVRILGDSSQFKSELQSVLQDIGSLRGQLEQATDVGQQVSQGFDRVSGAMRPLEQVSRMLSRIAAQAQALGEQPITLNVQPALAALAQLSAAIQAIAAQLMALAAMPIGVGVGGGPGVGAGGVGPIRQFADGGLVTGPVGRDIVPALLTAGEFVLSRAATDAIGHEFVRGLNVSVADRPHRPPLLRDGTSRVHSTTNHFGGITIQVAEPSAVNAVVRDLRLQGVHLRNRRG